MVPTKSAAAPYTTHQDISTRRGWSPSEPVASAAALTRGLGLLVVALVLLLGSAFALAELRISIVVDPVVDGGPGYRSAGAREYGRRALLDVRLCHLLGLILVLVCDRRLFGRRTRLVRLDVVLALSAHDAVPCNLRVRTTTTYCTSRNRVRPNK